MKNQSQKSQSAHGNQQSRLKTGILYFCASLPFLCSFGFHSIKPSPSESVNPIERPALTFQQYAVNLHTIELQSIVKARFRFVNNSKHVVTIKNLDPSCGCLNPRLHKKVYQPGEQGYFDVRVSTPNSKPGKKEYTIDVEYEDTKPRVAELAFKFTLPEDMVLVRPLGILEYVRGNEVFEKEIKVMDFREGQKLTVTGVKCISLSNHQQIPVSESFVNPQILNPNEIDEIYATASERAEKSKYDLKKITRLDYLLKPVPEETNSVALPQKGNIILAKGEDFTARVSEKQEEMEIERESIAGMVKLKIDPSHLNEKASFLVQMYTNDPKYPVISVPLNLHQLRKIPK